MSRSFRKYVGPVVIIAVVTLTGCDSDAWVPRAELSRTAKQQTVMLERQAVALERIADALEAIADHQSSNPYRR